MQLLIWVTHTRDGCTRKTDHLGVELICLFAQSFLLCVNNFRGEKIHFLICSIRIHFNIDEEDRSYSLIFHTA